MYLMTESTAHMLVHVYIYSCSICTGILSNVHHIYIHGHCVLGAGCRSKLERNKDRNVSEKIALGLPTGAPSQDSLFDQRLFNQSKVSSSISQ